MVHMATTTTTEGHQAVPGGEGAEEELFGAGAQLDGVGDDQGGLLLRHRGNLITTVESYKISL